MLSCYTQKLKTQVLPIYSQYMFNPQLINTAYTGIYPYMPIIINHRSQWSGGFGEAAPQTSSISINQSIGNHNSLGGLLIYDQTNPISRTQIELNYGYRTRINGGSILSMSLSGTYSMFQFTRQANDTYSEITDGYIDIVNQSDESTSFSDLNVGVVIANNRYDLGLSIRNLLAPELLNNDNANEGFDRIKYMVFHASFLGMSSTDLPFGLVPSIVIRKMGLIHYNQLIQADLNLKLIYRNRIWMGLSYRTNERAICPSIAIKTEKAFFGYTYDIGMSELGLHHNGSHNIAIGFLIRTKNTSNTLRHSPFDLNVGTQKIRLKKSSNNKHKSGL